MRGSSSSTFTPEERIGLRLSLDPKYQDISDTELYNLVESRLAGLTEEQAEGFWSVVKDVGGKALKVLPGVAKGALTGAATGGLPGALIGAAAGGVSGVVSASQPSQPPTPRVPQARRARVRRPAAAKVPGKPSSSAQLLQLLDNPHLRQVLLSLVLRDLGSKMTSVGGTPVATGDFLNLLGVKASSAAKEAAEDYATNQEESQSQSLDNDIDPAIPEHRAEVLMDLLQKEEHVRETSETDYGDLDSLEDSVLTLELR